MNDDVDSRFRALIEAEFGPLTEVDVRDTEPPPDSAESRAAVPRPGADNGPEEAPRLGRDETVEWDAPRSVSPTGAESAVDPPSGHRTWVPAEEDDDFVPPPMPPPVGRLAFATWIALGLIGLGLVSIPLLILGFLSTGDAMWLSLGGLGVGLLMLFTRLPRDRDPGDTGAVI